MVLAHHPRLWRTFTVLVLSSIVLAIPPTWFILQFDSHTYKELRWWWKPGAGQTPNFIAGQADSSTHIHYHPPPQFAGWTSIYTYDRTQKKGAKKASNPFRVDCQRHTAGVMGQGQHGREGSRKGPGWDWKMSVKDPGTLKNQEWERQPLFSTAGCQPLYVSSLNPHSPLQESTCGCQHGLGAERLGLESWLQLLLVVAWESYLPEGPHLKMIIVTAPGMGLWNSIGNSGCYKG